MDVLDRLRGRLIVSVQAWPKSPLDDPYVIAAMAAAAQANGAAAVRVQGVAHLLAVRARVQIPVIGLIKVRYPGYEPYITPTPLEVAEIIACGAEIVAFDATERAHPGRVSVAELIAVIHASGRAAMADCSTSSDASSAAAAGADIVATTLAGYTDETKGRSLPALDVVREMRALSRFVICEGGVASPEQVTEALDAGADAVVVGTAITNVDALVREFAEAADKKKHR